MIEACLGALMQGRLFEKHIFTERFFTAQDAARSRRAAPRRFQIDLEGHGLASAYEGERALVALERAQGFGQLKNMPRRLPVGCRRGGSGVCRVRVLSGEYRSDRMSRSHISGSG